MQTGRWRRRIEVTHPRQGHLLHFATSTLGFCPIYILPLQLYYSKLGPICHTPKPSYRVINYQFFIQLITPVGTCLSGSGCTSLILQVFLKWRIIIQWSHFVHRVKSHFKKQREQQSAPEDKRNNAAWSWPQPPFAYSPSWPPAPHSG